MLRTIQIVKRCASVKQSRAFQALYNPQRYAEVEQLATPKLNALVDVILSLNNRESEYLHLLLTENSLNNDQSILAHKIINRQGYNVQPIQYFYQQQWIKEEWKDSELLQFIHSQEIEQSGQQEEVQTVKQNYDVELTSLDVAQKIKIIKSLRQIFNLGLKQAKDFADKAPSMLKKNMKRQEAEKLKKDLQAVGCVITLK